MVNELTIRIELRISSAKSVRRRLPTEQPNRRRSKERVGSTRISETIIS